MHYQSQIEGVGVGGGGWKLFLYVGVQPMRSHIADKHVSY